MLRIEFPLLALLLLLLSADCLAVLPGNIYPLPKGYLSYDRLLQEEQDLASKHPDLASLRVIGFSGTENLPIHALAIGSASAQRKILVIGQHHGDEVLGVELALAWATELAVNHKHSKKIQAILEEFQFWIIPTLNPEAYRVVSSGQFQFKRKNNRDTDGKSGLQLRSDGVDLNRNYPVFWEQGAVVPGAHENYKGSSPMSEPEIKAVVTLAQENNFEQAIFYHSSASGKYSEKIFLPAINSGNADQKALYDKLVTFAKAYAKKTRKAYQGGRYDVGTTASSREGNARNYFFHIHMCGAFLVELGGVNAEGISVIHPDNAKRKQIVKQHVGILRSLYYKRSREKD